MEQVKLVCSYGGKLKTCRISKKLIYCGGDTRLIIVNRNVNFRELFDRLSYECSGGGILVGFKYEVPGEDHDLLVSITDDDDLEYMMSEFDDIRATSSAKSLRIKLFLDFQEPPKYDTRFSPDFLFGFDSDRDFLDLIDESALEEWSNIPPHDDDVDELIIYMPRCQRVM